MTATKPTAANSTIVLHTRFASHHVCAVRFVPDNDGIRFAMRTTLQWLHEGWCNLAEFYLFRLEIFTAVASLEIWK